VKTEASVTEMSATGRCLVGNYNGANWHMMNTGVWELCREEGAQVYVKQPNMRFMDAAGIHRKECEKRQTFPEGRVPVGCMLLPRYAVLKSDMFKSLAEKNNIVFDNRHHKDMKGSSIKPAMTVCGCLILPSTQTSNLTDAELQFLFDRVASKYFAPAFHVIKSEQETLAQHLISIHKHRVCITGFCLSPQSPYIHPQSKKMCSAFGTRIAEEMDHVTFFTGSMRGVEACLSIDHALSCHQKNVIHFRDAPCVAVLGDGYRIKNGITYVLEADDESNNHKEAMLARIWQGAVIWASGGGPTVDHNVRTRLAEGDSPCRGFSVAAMNAPGKTSGATGFVVTAEPLPLEKYTVLHPTTCEALKFPFDPSKLSEKEQKQWEDLGEDEIDDMAGKVAQKLKQLLA